MVYVILADGFEEMEAICPVDIMKRAGIMVKTVFINKPEVEGAHNIKVMADINIDDVNICDMELLMLPGGAGYENLDRCEKVHKLIDYANEKNIYIAAICAAPSILGKKGLLKNKNATCFPGFEKYLIGATIKEDKVCVDKNIITAKGAGAASDFGFKITELLRNKKIADDLKGKMQF